MSRDHSTQLLWIAGQLRGLDDLPPAAHVAFTRELARIIDTMGAGGHITAPTTAELLRAIERAAVVGKTAGIHAARALNDAVTAALDPGIRRAP